MKKFAFVIIICLLCASSTFAAPEDFLNGGLFEIDSMAATTTNIVGVNGPSLTYGVPMDSPSVGWINSSTSGNAWDLSDMNHNIWVSGSVTDVTAGGAWASLGLFDKHCSDGLAIGKDAAISYPSGSYGYGRNGGFTIVGGASADDENIKMKVEDGWGAPNGQTGEGQIGLGAFEFMLRYGFTDGPDNDTRTIRGWYREIGGTTWTDVGTFSALGYPINAGYTDPRAERYQNDQWDQTMFGITVVNDGGDLPGSYSTGAITLYREIDLAGDTNADGVVDEIDVTRMAANWGATGGATWQMGDFTGDGNIDNDDAAALAENWLSDGSAAAAAVPEPNSLILLGLGCLVLLAGKRIRR